MRKIPGLAAAALLLLGAPTHAGAQVRVTALIGATGSSSLVNDQVIETIEVKPALAPTFLVGASLPIGEKVRATLELGYGISSVEITEGGGPTEDFGTLGTFTAAVGLAGPILSRLDWRLGIGVLQYWPSEDTGIFADGVPAAAVFGAGLDWRQPLSERWTGVVGARYDFHLFTTPALESAGFSGSQQVSRVGLAVGAAWVFQ